MVPGVHSCLKSHNLGLRVVARNGFRCFTPLVKLFQMI